MCDPDTFSDEDQALFDKLAAWLVERRLETPAILFLESVRPMSFVGAQAMHFFEPFARAIFPVKDYERVARLMEQRSNLELLVRTIETAADRRQDEARARKADDA